MRTLRELRARVKELETSERELTKRVSSLTEQAVRRSNEHAELMHKSHELLVRYETFRAEVASKRTDDIRRAETEISYLRKQLAWTPVRDGLPTEPGVYEFLRNTDSVEIDALDIWRFDTELQSCTEWYWKDHDWFTSPLEARNYNWFRRIELPKEGET